MDTERSQHNPFSERQILMTENQFSYCADVALFHVNKIAAAQTLLTMKNLVTYIE